MNYKIYTTLTFDKWSAALKDRQAALAIAKRIDRASKGNLGDIEPVGEGISEMRIFIGQGYRLYFTIRNREIIVLLCGGNKTTQQQDIKNAKELAKNL